MNKAGKATFQYKLTDEWTSADWRNAAALTLIPGSCALVGMAFMLKDKSHMNWWEKAAKPSWAPTDVRVYSALDILTMAPLGVAAHMVCKTGGCDNPDVKMALTSYAAMGGLMFLGIPCILKHDMQLMSYSCLASTAAAALTTGLFYRINEKAGLMMVPFTAWMAFYACLSCNMSKLEKKEFKKI